MSVRPGGGLCPETPNIIIISTMSLSCDHCLVKAFTTTSKFDMPVVTAHRHDCAVALLVVGETNADKCR